MGGWRQCTGTQAGVPWGPSAAAGVGEKQPLFLPMIHFGSRVMEYPGEAGLFRWLWKVLTVGAPGSYPPPGAWCRGYPQGIGAKDQVNHIAHGTASLSTPQGPLQHLGILQRAEVLGFARRGARASDFDVFRDSNPPSMLSNPSIFPGLRLSSTR